MSSAWNPVQPGNPATSKRGARVGSSRRHHASTLAASSTIAPAVAANAFVPSDGYAYTNRTCEPATVSGRSAAAWSAPHHVPAEAGVGSQTARKASASATRTGAAPLRLRRGAAPELEPVLGAAEQ